MSLTLIGNCFDPERNFSGLEEKVAAAFYLGAAAFALESFGSGTRERLEAAKETFALLPESWAREIAWEILLK